MPIWGPLAVFLAGIATSLVAAALTAIVVYAVGVEIDSDDGEDALAIFGTFGQAAAWIGFSVLAVRLAARTDVGRRLGLQRATFWKSVGWALLAYVAFWIASGVVLATLGDTDAEQELVKDLRDEDALWSLIGFAALATIAAPLAEEIFFRGLLFGTLRSRIALVPAAVASGILFGVIHFDAPLQGIILLCVLGIALCLLYEVTGSLLPGIGLHALHNALTFSVTKELPWYGFVGVILGGTVLAVLLGMAIMRLRPVAGAPA
jgi:membrane protease YdiL (CAAX protease family)